MGDPRRLKKHYSRPLKLWDKDRIEEEKKLKEYYGLKAMREIWRASEELKRARRVARESLSLEEEEKKKNEQMLIKKLNNLGLLPANATLDDVLSLSVKDFLERRLQTIVYKKGLARTMKQARQLVVHGFIAVNGRRLTSPGYLLTRKEEETVEYFKPYKMPSNKIEVVEQKEELKENVQTQENNNANKVEA